MQNSGVPADAADKRAGKALGGLRERFAEPVDVASLVMARIMFGLLMLWMVIRYFGRDWIHKYWIEPEFNFGYFGFGWVAPCPATACTGTSWGWAHWQC